MKCKALLALAACLILGAEPPQDLVAKEIKNLQGTWRLTSLEAEGQKIPPEALKEAKLVIKVDKFTFVQNNVSHGGTFKIDPSKKPFTIDITFTDGPEKGTTLVGIYEVAGDVYKLCANPQGKRPTEFVSKPGTGDVLEVLEREKP